MHLFYVWSVKLDLGMNLQVLSECEVQMSKTIAKLRLVNCQELVSCRCIANPYLVYCVSPCHPPSYGSMRTSEDVLISEAAPVPRLAILLCLASSDSGCQHHGRAGTCKSTKDSKS